MADAAEYTDMTTIEEVEDAYSLGTKVSSFQAKSDANFSEKYLISKVGTDYFLIKMTDLKFAAGNNVAEFEYKEKAN